LVDDRIEHVIDAHRCERDDRVAVLDREPGESDAVAPQQLVLLTASLVELARAPGKTRIVCRAGIRARTLSRVPRTIPPIARRSRQRGTA